MHLETRERVQTNEAKSKRRRASRHTMAPTDDQVMVVRVGEEPSARERMKGHPVAFACADCGINVSPAAVSACQCKQQLAPTHLTLIAIGLASVLITVLEMSGAIRGSEWISLVWNVPALVLPPLGVYGLFRSLLDGPYCCKCLKEAGTWSTPYYWIRACRFCKKRAAGVPDVPSAAACELSYDQVQASTKQLIVSERFSRANSESRSGLLKRLQFLKEAGIPPMKVLPMSKLVELGRIPHSSEGFAVDAAEALAAFPEATLSRPLAPIYFFSHRWLRPNWCESLQKSVAHGTEEWAQAQRAGQRVGDPDDADATKARSLIQTLRWFVEEHSMTQATSWEESIIEPIIRIRGGRSLYERKPLQEVFLWIDWPCVDQSNPMPEIAAIPAYVACCSGIMAAYNDTYMSRAWCRVEILNAFAFCSCNTMHAHDKMYIRNGKGPRAYYASDWVVPPIIVVKEGFEYAGGKGFALEESVIVALPDPKRGQLTNTNERDVIDSLTDFAMRSRSFTWFRVWWNFHLSNVQTSIFLAFLYVMPWFLIGFWGFLIGFWGPAGATLIFCFLFGAVLRYTWMASRTVALEVSEFKLFYPNPGTVAVSNAGYVSAHADSSIAFFGGLLRFY